MEYKEDEVQNIIHVFKYLFKPLIENKLKLSKLYKITNKFVYILTICHVSSQRERYE